MFRFIAFFVLSLFLNNVWADCDITSKFNINVNVLPVKYDYSKTSNEIKKIPNIKTSNESQYVLGAYIPLLSIGLDYRSLIENSFTRTCNKIAVMNVHLKLESTIFIAKEIAKYRSTVITNNITSLRPIVSIRTNHNIISLTQFANPTSSDINS